VQKEKGRSDAAWIYAAKAIGRQAGVYMMDMGLLAWGSEMLRWVEKREIRNLLSMHARPRWLVSPWWHLPGGERFVSCLDDLPVRTPLSVPQSRAAANERLHVKGTDGPFYALDGGGIWGHHALCRGGSIGHAADATIKRRPECARSS
jgi:hypothetical protein